MRYFIKLSYNGTNYCGWQVQPNAISVQQRLQEALSLILREQIEVVGAGRTDAGVHASCMIAHFDSAGDLLDTVSWVERLNRLLPYDIAVHDLRKVRPDAHARFDAISRKYRYRIHFHKDVFLWEQSSKLHYKLDFDRMNLAASQMLKYTDFTSFSKLHTDVKTNNCKITSAQWVKDLEGDGWSFYIEADRFLRNMVRAIVGTLIDVGRGKISVEDFCAIIEKKDRGLAGTSVPGHALYLIDVTYPDFLYLD